MRSSFGLVFDEARGQVVMFGGTNNPGGGGNYSDTWIWEGTNWTQKIPATSPPKLSVYSMVYDSIRQESVFLGGLPDSGPINRDTWTWNGANWIKKAPALRPSERVGHSMAFDPVRQRTVLFGGQSGKRGPLLADTWLWDGTNWQSSDMTLTMAALPAVALMNNPLVYTVAVTNQGPSQAAEVNLVEELPVVLQ